MDVMPLAGQSPCQPRAETTMSDKGPVRMKLPDGLILSGEKGGSPVYEITVLSHFSGAHRLRHLHGKCEELHGHNWKIEVSVASRHVGKQGVALDFGILKQEVANVLASLDHTFLNDLPYFSKREPSSENIAKYMFDRLKPRIRKYAVTLKRVTAWESESASATYSGR